MTPPHLEIKDGEILVLQELQARVQILIECAAQDDSSFSLQ